LTGNTQTQTFSSSFASDDQTAPIIDPLSIDGTSVQNVRRRLRPPITTTCQGFKTSTVVLMLDGANVTAGASVGSAQISYTPPTALALGQHTVSVQVGDNGGNTSLQRNASFTIVDTTPPSVTNVTLRTALLKFPSTLMSSLPSVSLSTQRPFWQM
jgi:hypothetical protein